MTPDINPYQSPVEVEATETKPSEKARPLDYYALLLWPFVFGLNLIIPVMLGWGITTQHGRIGAGVAIFIYFSLGWIMCYYQPQLTRRLILGSFVTSLTQLFPILQFIAGIIAFTVVERFPNGTAQNPIGMGIDSELEGFIVTMIVGGILIAFSAIIGSITLLFATVKKKPRPLDGIEFIE